MSEYEAATYGERIAEVYDDWYAGQDTEGAGEPFFKCQCEAHFCVPAFRFPQTPKNEPLSKGGFFRFSIRRMRLIRIAKTTCHSVDCSEAASEGGYGFGPTVRPSVAHAHVSVD
jgi:hypothetical protein